MDLGNLLSMRRVCVIQFMAPQFWDSPEGRDGDWWGRRFKGLHKSLVSWRATCARPLEETEVIDLVWGWRPFVCVALWREFIPKEQLALRIPRNQVNDFAAPTASRPRGLVRRGISLSVGRDA